MNKLGARKTALLSAAFAVACVTGVFAAPMAQAHAAYVDLSRSGCYYTGYSDHGYAYTQKLGGSCTGHAWLRVTMIPGGTGSWVHDASVVRFYAPSGYRITKSEHKSCETCGVATITH
jgi:hypothetical protein